MITKQQYEKLKVGDRGVIRNGDGISQRYRGTPFVVCEVVSVGVVYVKVFDSDRARITKDNIGCLVKEPKRKKYK